MKRCCETEAKKSLRRHRDVAVCDGCGRLLLAHTNEPEHEKTKAELSKHGVAFEAGKVGTLLVVAKDRNPSPPEALDDEDEDEDDED